MKDRGLSGKALAAHAGVTKKTVSEWRHGKGPLHPTQMRAHLERAVLRGSATEEEPKDVWARQEFQDIRRYTACVEQLKRIADDEVKLKAVEAVLNAFTGWAREDWKMIFDTHTDHWPKELRRRLAEEQKSWRQVSAILWSKEIAD